MVDFESVIPIVKTVAIAGGVGLSWAWTKYSSNILDPSKPTPEKFEWPKAISTTVLAVGISIVFTLAGNALDVSGIDTYIGIFAGLSTSYIEPVVKAIWRAAEQKIARLN